MNEDQVKHMEMRIAELQFENMMLASRLKNSQSLANQFSAERAEIAERLWNEGWLLGPNGEVEERQHVVSERDRRVRHDVFKPWQIPITLWFRILPDDEGIDSLYYNHFEEGHVEQAAPTPIGETKFKGRWSLEHAYKTNELCPSITISPPRHELEAHQKDTNENDR